MEDSSQTKPPVDKKHKFIDSNLRNVECPYCGGRMLQGRKTFLQGVHIYWQKPWGPTIRMDEAVMPLACVECGGVILALRDSGKVSREWHALSEEEKNRIIAGD